MMEVLHSSKTSALARATQCDVPEDGIFHSHRRENLKSYNCTSILSGLPADEMIKRKRVLIHGLNNLHLWTLVHCNEEISNISRYGHLYLQV
jgi:hypothetical protein